MKIFFCASIHGKPKFETHYRVIESKVKSLGHTFIGDHIFQVDSEMMKTWTLAEHTRFIKHIFDEIKKADAIFADVSYSSTSVGYLLASALTAGKATVAFYSGKEEPHLFPSLEELNDKFQVVKYANLEDLEEEVTFAVEFASQAQDTRFNFFLTPDLASYLNWISRYKKAPRSVYMRDLIEEDMATQGYQG